MPWLTDPTMAKVSVLIVNLWLGFPYMFLVCMGALQSIPDELQEAATVDGAKPWAVFRLIKLPLLLVTVAPLLIASFAFNFNNFNMIYMLTDGGPRDSNAPIPVGFTDILITMVYKVAFTGQSRDYGLASAYSIIIFIVVAVISIIAFRRTKTPRGAELMAEQHAGSPGRRTAPRRRGESSSLASTRAGGAIAEAQRRPPKRPFKFGRWFRATGWRHIVGIVMLVFALFPIVFVISSSLNPQGTLTGSNALFSKIGLESYVRILTDPQVPFPTWFANTLIIAGITAGRHGVPRRARGVLVLAHALHGPALRPHHDRRRADVPADARGRRDLPAHDRDRRLVPGDRPEHAHRADHGVPRRCARREHVPHVRLLQHDPRVDRRGGEDRRRRHARIFFTIILRLAAPILAVVALLSFIFSVNEFVVASVLLIDTEKQTLAVGLTKLVSNPRYADWSAFSAGAVMAALPVVALFLFLQKYIVGGLTAGAVK